MFSLDGMKCSLVFCRFSVERPYIIIDFSLVSLDVHMMPRRLNVTPKPRNLPTRQEITGMLLKQKIIGKLQAFVSRFWRRAKGEERGRPRYH